MLTLCRMNGDLSIVSLKGAACDTSCEACGDLNLRRRLKPLTLSLMNLGGRAAVCALHQVLTKRAGAVR